MKIRAFITHKLSERYSDCQDRFCINEKDCRISVSDGMSQSVFPDYWAEILSQHYAKEGHCTDEDRKELCKKWMEYVVHYINQEINKGKTPWRLQNCIESQNGAGATICGVQFRNAKEWQGQVLGDSCVIEVDNVYGIKIHTSEEKAFDSYPDYYESFPAKVGRGTIKDISGEISNSNFLLLVSDPFSEFLFNNKEKCIKWLDRIRGLKSHEEYCSLVDDWREEGLHNDDSTLCIVEYDGSDKFNIDVQDDINNLIVKENDMLKQSDAEIKAESEDTVTPEDIGQEGYKQIEQKSILSGDENTSVDNSEGKRQKFSSETRNSSESHEITDDFATWIKERGNIIKNNGKQKAKSHKLKRRGSNPNIGVNEFDNFCQEVIEYVRKIIKRIKEE